MMQHSAQETNVFKKEKTIMCDACQLRLYKNGCPKGFTLMGLLAFVEKRV